MNPNSLKHAINDALIEGQSGIFAQRCEFHAVKSPIGENDIYKMSIFGCVNSIFASQNKRSKAAVYYT